MDTPFANEYIPTIIDSRPLLPRLGSELRSLNNELKLAWPDFKSHPLQSSLLILRTSLTKTARLFFAPNVLAAFLLVIAVVLFIEAFDARATDTLPRDEAERLALSDVEIIKLSELDSKLSDSAIGRNGNARVGFQKDKGEGSVEVGKRSSGGGSGGDHDKFPSQTGEIPPPSSIPASIPSVPPVHTPSLPAAGIDIDPALWADLKAPVFGDPRSNSSTPSKGPGDGGGIGTNQGVGIGDGDGNGVGRGKDGNMGGGERQFGCCGSSGATGNNYSWDERILRGKEVEQRAKLLSKPEPQYTEEARLNQITGTVMLRVVFSSLGQVEQIKAVQTLPFGLTERAIAAARQIKFLPATKGGRPVSVYMQLEYNFNLY